VDHVKKAKIVLNSIKEMVKSALENAEFNTKKRAVVNFINENGTVNIFMNGEIYNNIKVRPGLSPKINEIVWIELPNNKMTNAFVDVASFDYEYKHNVDGGSASTVYMDEDILDGGNANG